MKERVKQSKIHSFACVLIKFTSLIVAFGLKCAIALITMTTDVSATPCDINALKFYFWIISTVKKGGAEEKTSGKNFSKNLT